MGCWGLRFRIQDKLQERSSNGGNCILLVVPFWLTMFLGMWSQQNNYKRTKHEP